MSGDPAAWPSSKALCFSLLVSATSGVLAQQFHVPPDARLHGLSALYQGEVPANVAGICSQRFEATHDDWDLAVHRFNGRNQVQLAELDALQARILAALKAARAGSPDIDTWAAIVNARSEQQLVVAYLLAPLSDQEARSYCDQARRSLGETVVDDASLGTARAATAAAIEDLGKH